MLQPINKLKYFLILAVFLNSENAVGQAIVNIEDDRREGEIGFFANIGAKLDASRGNRDRDFYSLKFRFDNNSEAVESFLILQQSERKSNSKVIDDSTFMHGRYIFVGEKNVNWELFAQYSENPFRNYKKRSVFGGGIRYEISSSARFGGGLLSEDETDLSSLSKTTERFGFYLHNSFSVAENLSFSPTIYFQPSINDFENDYKASIILAWIFKVNENLNISMQYSSFHDSNPPMLAEKSDESISTMFSYNFN